MSNSSRSRIQSHSGQPRLGNCREIADEYGIKYHTLLKLAHAGAFRPSSSPRQTARAMSFAASDRPI